MGPGKPCLPGAPPASSTRLHGRKVKALPMQLQFNRNVPAVPENLSLRFSNPHPIVVEKLKPPNDQRNLAGSDDPSIRSSGMFSVISEERLKLALQLAKRDIKRRHLKEQVKQGFGDAVNKSLLAQKSQQQKNKVFENLGKKNVLKSQTPLKYQQRLVQPSKMETTSSGARVYLYAPSEGKLIPAVLSSSSTHNMRPDPKPNVNHKGDKNVQEIQRLQKELRSCIQKIEDLTKKERDEENLDPGEEQRVCTQRQKQAARSARMLYVLQQQVKEIQDDLEKLSPHKIKHTKKSQAVSRLAAAHRGAIRALQAFANQFTNETEQRIPAHYKELGGLIRQLSLCSAKLEVDSSTSDVVTDILLQVEDLISLLEKKQTPKKVKKCLSACHGKSPVSNETFPARKQLTSPKREKKHLILMEQRGQEPRKSPSARGLLIDKHQHVAKTSTVQKMNSHAHIWHSKVREANDLPTPERSAILQGNIDALVRSRAVKKDPILESGPLKKKDMLTAKSQGMPQPLKPRQVQPQGKHTRFQETTIAFQLKGNKRLVKESRIPWVPPNPTSPLASPKRIAWCEAEASRSMKVLTDLSRGEIKKIQKLRSQGASPTQCTDKDEKAVLQEQLEPLLDRAQQINTSLETNCHLKDSSVINQLSTHAAGKITTNADILSEKVLDDLLEDTAQELWNMEQQKRLQAEAQFLANSPSLETMLQRMEEIERYQEAVCRRFTQIVYSDLEFRAQEDKTDKQRALIAKIPASPQSIQITSFTPRIEPETDVLFEKLLDDNDIDENQEAREKLLTRNDVLQLLTQDSLQKERYVSLSVTKHMLQSILDYNSRYKHHLKLIFHEAVGGFNPWQIAESLAEELTEEALCDVAAELQDVCEDYAEAVFTSEFLQPAQMSIVHDAQTNGTFHEKHDGDFSSFFLKLA